jgi:hypothetical protein
MPAYQATEEAEIENLQFHASPGKKIYETPHLKGKKLV